MNKKNYVKIMKDIYFEKNTKIDEYTEYVTLFLAKKYFPKKDTIIADIGVGFGQTAIPLAITGYKNIIGVDIDDGEFRTLHKNNKMQS